MSFVPAAHFLADFGAKDIAPDVAADAVPQAIADPEAVWAERIAEAHARGVDEGRQAAEAEALADLEEQRASQEQALAAARQSWCEGEGPLLAKMIETAIGEMKERIAESVERILRPFIAQSVRDQAIAQLSSVIAELVASTPGVALEISGSEDLLDCVRASLPASVANVSYVTTGTAEVHIKAGASIIETRIADWLKSVEGQVL